MAYYSKGAGRRQYDDQSQQQQSEDGEFAFPTRGHQDDLFDPLASGRSSASRSASSGSSSGGYDGGGSGGSSSFDGASRYGGGGGSTGFSPRSRGGGGYGSGSRYSDRGRGGSAYNNSPGQQQYSSGYVSQLGAQLYSPQASGVGGAGYGGPASPGYSPRGGGASGGYGGSRGYQQQQQQQPRPSASGGWGTGASSSGGGGGGPQQQPQPLKAPHHAKARWRRAGLYLKRRAPSAAAADERSAAAAAGGGGGAAWLSVVSVAVEVRVVDLFTRVSLRQTFRNSDDIPAEVEFVLPVARHCVVCDFRAVVDGLQLVADVQEQPAPPSGSTGDLVLLDEDVYLWKVHVGAIPAGKTVEVHVAYVGELAMKGGSVQFVLPSLILPEVADPKKKQEAIEQQSSWRRKDDDWAPPASKSSFQAASYPLHVELDVLMPSPIVAVVSPSHPSLQRSFAASERPRSTRITLPVPTDGVPASPSASFGSAAESSNLELLFELSEPHTPHAWLETATDDSSGRVTQAAAFVWYPDFVGPQQLQPFSDGKTALTDLSLDWGVASQDQLQQSPAKLRGIFVLGRLLVYALLPEPVVTERRTVRLKAAASDGPRVLTAYLDPATALEGGEQRRLLHTLASRKMLRELERSVAGAAGPAAAAAAAGNAALRQDEQQLRQLSKSCGLASSLCTVLAPRDEFFAVPDGSGAVGLRPAPRLPPGQQQRFSEFARPGPQAPQSPTGLGGGGGSYWGRGSSPRSPAGAGGSSTNFGWGSSSSASSAAAGGSQRSPRTSSSFPSSGGGSGGGGSGGGGGSWWWGNSGSSGGSDSNAQQQQQQQRGEPAVPAWYNDAAPSSPSKLLLGRPRQSVADGEEEQQQQHYCARGYSSDAAEAAAVSDSLARLSVSHHHHQQQQQRPASPASAAQLGSPSGPVDAAAAAHGRLRTLCSLQRPDGSWALDESLARCISLPLHELQKQCTRPEDSQCFATALAIAWCEREHNDRMTEWWPSAQAAAGFLSKQFTLYDWHQRALLSLQSSC